MEQHDKITVPQTNTQQKFKQHHKITTAQRGPVFPGHFLLCFCVYTLWPLWPAVRLLLRMYKFSWTCRVWLLIPCRPLFLLKYVQWICTKWLCRSKASLVSHLQTINHKSGPWWLKLNLQGSAPPHLHRHTTNQRNQSTALDRSTVTIGTTIQSFSHKQNKHNNNRK